MSTKSLNYVNYTAELNLWRNLTIESIQNHSLIFETFVEDYFLVSLYKNNIILELLCRLICAV